MTDSILDVLDPEQLLVATSLDRPVVVLAGAGTGKTRAITHRVAHAVREGRYQPGATLAVTFTTRAAGEMRSRLAALGVRAAQARTIHAAALRQCQYFWPQTFRVEFPQVADNTFAFTSRAAAIVLRGKDTALVRDLESEISWAKSSNVTPEAYPTLAAVAGRSVGGADPEQVAAVMREYERAKQAAGRVDFNDILLCAAALLAEHPAVAEAVRAQYRHFVVDEYQDVSALQHRLIQLWVDGRDDVCVVGDPNQAIHSFAGARADYLLSFSEEHGPADTLRLVRNYRSTPEVLGLGNAVLGVSRGSAQALRPTRGSGPAPEFHIEGSEAEEARSVVAWLARLHADGTPWSELAVLYRINAQAPALEAAMTEAAIPYTVRGTDAYYERPEVRQAVQALIAGADADGTADPLGLLTAHLSRVGWTEDPPAGMGRQRERWESLGALRDMIIAEAASREAWQAEDFRDWLRDRASLQASPVADSVTLSTMHSSKGLEWDGVAVIGAREGLIPYVQCQTEPSLSEERRLLHVAVTRARTRLRISYSRTAGRGGSSSPSRFLAGHMAAPDRRAPVNAGRGRRSRSCSVCRQPLMAAADRKLGRHRDCEVSYDETLLAALKDWRRDEAAAAKVPAYVVFTDATLQAIAESVPVTPAGLIRIPGVGAVKLERYGASCLAVIAGHRPPERPSAGG